MKFVEYVEIRELSDEAFLAELFANEEYNPEGYDLQEVGGLLDKAGQMFRGLFNMGSSAAVDTGRGLMNMPRKLLNKAREYGSAFQIGAKMSKAKQLKTTMGKIQKALETDPDLAGIGKKGLLIGAVKQINNVLDAFMSKTQGMQDEFAAQRRDRSALDTGYSTGDASSRAGGFDRRAAAREEAKSGTEAAREAARRARGIA